MVLSIADKIKISFWPWQVCANFSRTTTIPRMACKGGWCELAKISNIMGLVMKQDTETCYPLMSHLEGFPMRTRTMCNPKVAVTLPLYCRQSSRNVIFAGSFFILRSALHLVFEKFFIVVVLFCFWPGGLKCATFLNRTRTPLLDLYHLILSQ